MAAGTRGIDIAPSGGDGAATPDDYIERAGRFYPDDQFYLGAHYAGISMGCEIVPILRAQIMGLMNLQDTSGLAVWTLVYNISDEADFIGGMMIPWGRAPAFEGPPTNLVDIRSEFGTSALTVFLETRFYF